MPRPYRRRLRAFARNDTAGSAVETALILSLTAAMVFMVKTTAVAALVRPTRQAFDALVRALS
jgi:Flp pilus assembly pilin Flp